MRDECPRSGSEDLATCLSVGQVAFELGEPDELQLRLPPRSQSAFLLLKFCYGLLATRYAVLHLLVLQFKEFAALLCFLVVDPSRSGQQHLNMRVHQIRGNRGLVAVAEMTKTFWASRPGELHPGLSELGKRLLMRLRTVGDCPIHLLILFVKSNQ